VPYKQYMTAVP